MRILILSDIHGNWHALEAILSKESYDYLVFLGDVVDFGPNPRECVRFLIKSSYAQFWGVRGDHDHAMAYAKECLCNNELNTLSNTTSEWSEDHLESQEIGFLRTLPLDNQFSIEGLNFYISHGNSSYFKGHPKPRVNYDLFKYDFILSGHSHKPYLRQIGNKSFLDPGSVGQPRLSSYVDSSFFFRGKGGK